MKKLDVLAAPLEERSLKLLLFGAGELGKEIAIEAQRLGMEVIAVDRYERAPAQQVAHKAYTVNMMDANAMRSTPISPPKSRVRSVRESELPLEKGMERWYPLGGIPF